MLPVIGYKLKAKTGMEEKNESDVSEPVSGGIEAK